MGPLKSLDQPGVLGGEGEGVVVEDLLATSYREKKKESKRTILDATRRKILTKQKLKQSK